jgi:CHAD domain-containing protein
MELLPLAASLVQWRRQREQFHARLAVTLQARPFTALLHALETLASRLESTGDETKTGGKTARSHVRRLLKRTRRFGRSIDLHAPDTKVHRLRIHCRKLRYACECLAAVYGDATARFTKRATRLQGVLGHHQDLSVASRRLRCALRSPVTCPTPASRAVLQTLLAQVAAEQKRSHRACLKAWRRFDRHPSQRALLNRLG